MNQTLSANWMYRANVRQQADRRKAIKAIKAAKPVGKIIVKDVNARRAILKACC